MVSGGISAVVGALSRPATQGSLLPVGSLASLLPRPQTWGNGQPGSISKTSLGQWSALSDVQVPQSDDDLAGDLSAVTAGTCVVDVRSGRRAIALGPPSRTHCKVRFLRARGGSGCLGEPAEEGDAEFTPLEHLRVCDGLWEGTVPVLQENQNLRDGLSASENCGVLDTTAAIAARKVGSGRRAVIPRTLPALMRCSATRQALEPRPPNARVERIRPCIEALESSRAKRTVAFLRRRDKQRRAVSHGETSVAHLTESKALLERFKSLARARFGGSIGAAWHVALDTRGAGQVGYQEFVRGGRALGFTGNYRMLWSELTACNDTSHGLIGLEQLDAEAARLLEEFRTFFGDRDIKLEDLWENHLDKDGSGRCSKEEFFTVLLGMGWSRRKTNQLFRMLDTGMQQDLTLDELELVGLPRRVVEQGSTCRELRAVKDREARQKVLADFHGYLVRHFNSVVRAWRLGLDVDGDGKLRFSEFCASCKNIGFQGPLRTLWSQLDEERVGSITLHKLDPEASEQLEEFRALLEENYRTLDDVWERVFDVSRSGRCLLDDFVLACRDTLRWQGNATRMFRWLDLHSRGVLTIDAAEFLGMRRRIVKDSNKKQSIADRQTKDNAETQAVLNRFKLFLSQRCGNLVRAWRRELDPDDDGKLQFTEFCKQCRQLGFQGNLKSLWLSLDKADTGYISLEDLDPDAMSYFAELRQLILIFFNDLDTVWASCFDTAHAGKCFAEEFRRGCRLLGFHRSPSRLFKYLDMRNDNFISMEQMEFLKLPRASCKEDAAQFARDNCQQARTAFEQHLRAGGGGSLCRSWRRYFCSGPRECHLSEKLNAHEFCAKCREMRFRGNYLKVWMSLVNDSSQADETLCTVLNPKAHRKGSFQADDPKGRRMGSRCGVDPSQFSSWSCGAVEESFSGGGGCSGTVDHLGHVTLLQLDPEVHTEVNKFRAYCDKEFGTTEDTWRALLHECLESDFDAWLRKVEFLQAVRTIGYPGDAEVVFEACDIDMEFRISAAELRFLRIGDVKHARTPSA